MRVKSRGHRSAWHHPPAGPDSLRAPGRRALTGAALGLLILVASPSAGPITPTQLTSLKQFLGRQNLLFRPPANQSVTVYVPVGAGLGAFEYRSMKAFRLRAPEPVTLRSISGTPYRVDASFRSRRLGTLRLAVYPPPNQLLDSLALHTILAAAIAPRETFENLPSAFGNRLSRIAHARGSNHLPSLPEREPFPTIADAAAAGYTSCSICFHESPLIPEYYLERELGDLAAAQLLTHYSLTTDASLQQRCESAGRRVLARWPFALRGYSYTFSVIDCPFLNALACPGGRIFVTAPFLRLIERESELEALLAHEITHVERRHGLQQFKLHTKAV